MGESSIIEKLPQIIKDGKKEAKEILERPFKETAVEKEEIIPKSSIELSTYKNKCINQFYQGDNLIVIEKLLKKGYKGKIDLIYIDPPFLTKANYKGKIVVKNGEGEETIEHFAYKDIWEDGLASYLEMIYIRLCLMRELLSEKGTIYVHLDYRTVHYVKVLMDEIFHEENFINEVIWAYKSGGVSKRYYSRKHDTILVYSKTRDYIFNSQLEKSYNRGLKPYRFKGVEEFEDQLGWYTLVNLKDVWQIDMIGRTSKERVGYDTQKPEKLLERIILTSSNEDSIVADFFAGSGTTGIVAEKFNRKWIMSDKGALSLITVNKRLTENNSKPYYLYKIDDKFKGESKLLIKSMEISKDKRGKEELHIELDKYCLHIDKIDIKDKYKEKIKGILLKDSTALIDFIGIDINYDGKVPLITYQYYRKDDNLTINSRINIKDDRLRDTKRIFIKCIDVFGFQCSAVYEINNERVVICQEN